MPHIFRDSAGNPHEMTGGFYKDSAGDVHEITRGFYKDASGDVHEISFGTRVTITLPSNEYENVTDFIRWALGTNDRISLGTALSTDGTTEIFLQQIQLPDTNTTDRVRILTAASQTADAGDAGPDFSSEFESSGTIRMVASNGDSVTLTGITDPAEPYLWTPSNISEVITLATTISGLTDQSLTVTFSL